MRLPRPRAWLSRSLAQRREVAQSAVGTNRAILKRFFNLAAGQLQTVNPALSDKLRRATPHWLRHTHATLSLAAGVDLKTVRDNLGHASIATTSVYLDADDVQRAKQLNKAFPA